jgi:AraC-like DNA-binding protein
VKEAGRFLQSEWEAAVCDNDAAAILHNAETENRILEAIRSGDVDGLKLAMQDTYWEPDHYQPTVSALRRYKNLCLTFNSLCSRAANQGGSPTVYIRSICAQYAAQIELCGTIRELKQLQEELAIFYCENVRTAHTDAYGKQLKDVIACVESNMAGEVRLTKIATQLGISYEALSRCINQEYGGNFSFLVNQLRIRRACQYLYLPMSIAEIAEKTGYKSASQFCRHFRAVTGMTPTQWRAQNRCG